MSQALVMKKTPAKAPEEKAIDPLARLVAENLHTLLELQGKSSAGLSVLKKAGLSNGTAGRLLTPDGTALRLEYVGIAAKALGVQPWHLLLPDLQATATGGVISVEGMRARQWPFVTLRREEIESLKPQEIERLERAMRHKIAELEEDRPIMSEPRKLIKRN